LDACYYARIHAIQQGARAKGLAGRPRWPAIVLRTPKGWTGPKEVGGLAIEGTSALRQGVSGGHSGPRLCAQPAAWWGAGRGRGHVRGHRRSRDGAMAGRSAGGAANSDVPPAAGAFRAHQVPLPDARLDPVQREMLEVWMKSYRPDEVFDESGRLRGSSRRRATAAWAPIPTRMGAGSSWISICPTSAHTASRWSGPLPSATGQNTLKLARAAFRAKMSRSIMPSRRVDSIVRSVQHRASPSKTLSRRFEVISSCPRGTRSPRVRGRHGPAR
jgi:XFP-like protein